MQTSDRGSTVRAKRANGSARNAKPPIADLLTERAGDAFFDAKVKVLSAYIKAYIAEEEAPDSEIFAKARAAEVDLEDLGRRIEERKPRLMEATEENPFDEPPRRGARYRTDLGDDDDDRARRGDWFDDPEGNSAASRRGWRDRRPDTAARADPGARRAFGEGVHNGRTINPRRHA